jgi:hypothetical protein
VIARSMKLGALLGVLLALCAPLGCEAEPTDSTGGETHFLRLCSNDPAACGTALSCLCGVCTVACQVADSCSSFAGAECTARSSESCPGAVQGNVCDVACTSDQDCVPLSPEHRCEGGSCRLAPEDPGPGLGGGTGSGGSASVPPDTCVMGTTAANEVLIVGDSFFATSHQITAYLEDLARGAGTIGTGDRYRDASRLTNNALALSSYGILDQYQSAAAEAEVKVVIMNGGGADALLGSCDTIDETCPLLSAAAAALDDLLATAAADGVTGVVFAGYPDPGPEGVRAKMDVLRPMLEASCAASPVPCHFLDLRDTFYGNYDQYVLADGMNPTELGSEATAGAIWESLQDNCLAQ